MPDVRTPVVDAEIFGQLLRRSLSQRKASLRLRLDDVARNAGVSKQFVQNILNGDAHTGLAKALRVAQAVGLTLYSHRRLGPVPRRYRQHRKDVTTLPSDQQPAPVVTLSPEEYGRGKAGESVRRG